MSTHNPGPFREPGLAVIPNTWPLGRSDASPTKQVCVEPPIIMRDAKRWLLSLGKVPHYISGIKRNGQLDSDNDIAQLASYAEALAAFNAGNYSCLGFALGPDGTGSYWQGIDLDNIEANGLVELANSLPGYVEWSPSGRGVHAIGYGAHFPALTPKGGIECYSSGRFFTFTGHRIRCSR